MSLCDIVVSDEHVPRASAMTSRQRAHVNDDERWEAE